MNAVTREKVHPLPATADHDGAVGIAAQWCAAARELPDPPSVMAFGTPQSAFVLVGETRSLCLQRYADEPMLENTLWSRLEDFCRAPTFLAGYIGFDAVWPDGTRRPAATAAPTLHFWEPEGVIRIDVGACGHAEVSVLRKASAVVALRPRPLGAFEEVAMGTLDGELRLFRESVALTIHMIRRGESKRLTIARRIDLPDNLDLLASFAVPPTGRADLSRSFYVATPMLELAGHSPELLGRGDRHSVNCYKLSGTAPRHRDPLEDARRRSRFLTDTKVLNEHRLSIESTRAALEDIGAVSAGPMEVFDRRNLRHLMTPLHVAIRPDTSWSTIMRALLPSGAQPRVSGLRSLDELERISRGAYYGIIGLRTPEGDFEFSQVLRTLFRDHSGAYTFVGAAVTDGSTVDGESDETKLKLDDVMARRRVPDAVHTA